MTTISRAKYHRIDWSADLTDAPVTRSQYGVISFRPTHIVVTYVPRDDKWIGSSVKIHGPQHKKDGTDGVDTRSNHYYMGPTGDVSGLPDWVCAIVLANIPEEVTHGIHR